MVYLQVYLSMDDDVQALECDIPRLARSLESLCRGSEGLKSSLFSKRLWLGLVESLSVRGSNGGMNKSFSVRGSPLIDVDRDSKH